MKVHQCFVFACASILFFGVLTFGACFSQDAQKQQPSANPPTSQQAVPDSELQDKLKDQVEDISKTLDQSETVQEVSAGLLEPIYLAAEYIAFPAFYWIAFAMMMAGVISFAGQLVFAKFFLLFRGHLNIKEIISDTVGFLISAIGLILTTQAATENSNFTTRPAMVVSSAVVGALLGFVFYWWGQSQEFRAARGSKTEERSRKTKMR